MLHELSREKCCCFTGHRPEKLAMTESEAKPLLRAEIEKAIHDGFTTFISGMARGIDLWAAETVLDLRAENPSLQLVCAVPYDGFERRWNALSRGKYRKILENADMVKFVCQNYSPYVFQLRNVWMVDRSNRVIAAYRGGDGGTKNTIKYARHVGVTVCYV